MKADGCKLKWDKPEDDGGEPLEGYVVERMDVESGRWVPVCTTKEPECDVTGLNEGKDYMFRVKAVNSEGESEPLVTESATTAKNPFGTIITSDLYYIIIFSQKQLESSVHHWDIHSLLPVSFCCLYKFIMSKEAMLASIAFFEYIPAPQRCPTGWCYSSLVFT